MLQGCWAVFWPDVFMLFCGCEDLLVKDTLAKWGRGRVGQPVAGTDEDCLFSKHPEFPPNLEVTDEVLEKAAGTDVNNM